MKKMWVYVVKVPLPKCQSILKYIEMFASQRMSTTVSYFVLLKIKSWKSLSHIQQKKSYFPTFSQILFKALSIYLCFLFCFVLFLQLVKLAKKLKKEKVNVDVVNFGEEVSHFSPQNMLILLGFFMHNAASSKDEIKLLVICDQQNWLFTQKIINELSQEKQKCY